MSFDENTGNGIVYLTAQNIHTPHAFTTRRGGVSQGIYSSLNLGINRGDAPAHVRENYNLVCGALGIEISDVVRSNQVHGARVRGVTLEDRGELFKSTPPEADGLITCDTGVALMVFTADCVPILLHDRVCGVIGAIHAGWRGTVLDIAGVAVQRMVDDFGCRRTDISAAIGPCISKCCYETGQDVADALQKTMGKAADNCISVQGGRFMVNLKESNRLLLERAGLIDVTISDECTFCSNDKYWSHRRTNGQRGSQAAVIVKHAG